MSKKIELTIEEAEENLYLLVGDQSLTFTQFVGNLLKSTHEESLTEGYGDGFREGVKRGYLNGYVEGTRDRAKDH